MACAVTKTDQLKQNLEVDVVVGDALSLSKGVALSLPKGNVLSLSKDDVSDFDVPTFSWFHRACSVYNRASRISKV